MRLYLSANSKKHVGYTPDWLKVSFEENGIEYDLFLDIQGETDYDKNTLCCRCKGELIPWVLWDLEEGDDIDLSELSEEEMNERFPAQRIAEIICNSEYYEVGIYPVDNFELAESDKLTECHGRIEIYIDENHYYEKEFDFEVELNIY